MNTEIELKYLVQNDNCAEIISSLLAQQNYHVEHSEKTLSNCYFDTPDQVLRQHDMGLRIRTAGGKHEQTIKTAGKVIGGLHQRPEFNINVESTFPELSLFPNHIWLTSQDVDAIQQNLISLFSTDFTRQIWLVTLANGSVVEMAFDQGEIKASGDTETLCEVELELVTGSHSDLFELATLLFAHLSIRPGIKSKAARGYALWKKQQYLPDITPFELVPLTREQTIAKGFVAGLNFGLQQLQVMLNAYIESPSLIYLSKTVEVLALLRHGFWLFKEHLPEKATSIRDELSHFMKLFTWVDNAIYIQELIDKTGNYRKRIELSEQLLSQLKLEQKRFPNSAQVTELIYSERFNLLQLSLLKLLLTLSEQEEEIDSESLVSFAQQCLDKGLDNIAQQFSNAPSLTSEQYLAQQALVIRSLLTGSWFGHLYEKQSRIDFRSPWLDIKHGLSELQTLWIIQTQLSRLEQPPKKLINWQQTKVESLLLALDNSRISALSIEPYWRIL
ncbi:CYTH domain-containing protein [Thalassotalea sp. PLHSN55]|uniref:CYTH domain-containing protein n=1 Tax=Thalassotalea sp. PLHSN55 TaxID=3435888 RepID=UPI003F876E15